MPSFKIEENGYSIEEVDLYVKHLSSERDKLEELCKEYREQLNDYNIHPQQDGSTSILDQIALKQAELTQQTKPKKVRRKSLASELLFYAVLVIALVMMFAFYGGGTGEPRSIFGFSMMRVLTMSMQDEIPKDSIVVIKTVEPNTLKVGDDITYLLNENTTVTHRIIDIRENHAGTGARGFQTQGTMNGSPDSEIVPAQNVVGKVIFHNLVIGKIIGFVRSHPLWIAFFTVLMIGLYMALRVVFAKNNTGGKR